MLPEGQGPVTLSHSDSLLFDYRYDVATCLLLQYVSLKNNPIES